MIQQPQQQQPQQQPLPPQQAPVATPQQLLDAQILTDAANNMAPSLAATATAVGMIAVTAWAFWGLSVAIVPPQTVAALAAVGIGATAIVSHCALDTRSIRNAAGKITQGLQVMWNNRAVRTAAIATGIIGCTLAGYHYLTMTEL